MKSSYSSRQPSLRNWPKTSGNRSRTRGLAHARAIASARDIPVDNLELTLGNHYTMEGSALQGTMIGGALTPELDVVMDTNADHAPDVIQSYRGGTLVYQDEDTEQEPLRVASVTAGVFEVL